ncbi:MAG: alginate lyase family protein, partial [Phycisphaerae bacterium]
MATATKTAVCYLLCAALSASVPAAEVPAVRHPNLLLNRQEIEQVRAKVRRHEWAARLLDRVKEMAKDPGRNIRETALAYALTGEKRYADQARRHLTGQARHGIGEYEKLDLKLHPEYGAWTPWGTYAWAYDLTHETFSPEERQLVERWLRMACKAVIEGEKLWTTTPNLVFGKHFNVALVGYCLGDRELIEWGLNDPGAHGPRRGGFYQVLDSMINDGRFWGETPIYALHYDVHGMLALAEAAMHYDGTDLYRHVSKASGASIKSVIDGYIRMGFPVEQTGASSIRMATYGDGSTSYSPGGKLWETFLVPGDLFPGNLEVAYKRYKDPAYGWIIGLNRKRDAFVSYGRAVWGYVALTHGEPLGDKLTPPAAPSGVYSQQGFAFLRADETPAYWTSGALAAMVMLGKPIGHGHNDFYSLVLHGKGRLLYPDLNVIQYEPTYLRWTREGIAHSTLLVDHESPRGGPFTTRHEFTDDVKFLALRGSAFEDIDQSRVLLLTREYLADFFHAADRNGRDRAMDWVLHGLGRLYPGGPATFRATHDLVPFYWWIDNEKSRTVDGTWRADWIQSSAGLTRGLQFGPEWFAQTAGVRMTMLGTASTRVYCGDGPITDGPPYGRIDGNPEGSSPMVLARRKAAATTFAAVHEAYRDRPSVGRVSRLAEDDHAVAIVVAAPAFTDFVLAAFDGKEHTLAAGGGPAFSFSNYAYLRVAEG